MILPGLCINETQCVPSARSCSLVKGGSSFLWQKTQWLSQAFARHIQGTCCVWKEETALGTPVSCYRHRSPYRRRQVFCECMQYLHVQGGWQRHAVSRLRHLFNMNLFENEAEPPSEPALLPEPLLKPGVGNICARETEMVGCMRAGVRVCAGGAGEGSLVSAVPHREDKSTNGPGFR